ncbi:MAG: sialate O-acetylesterase [Paludibacter sp.]
MHRIKIKVICLLSFTLLVVFPIQADVKPNSLFASNAVLQRDKEIPVWGTADKDEKVIVELCGQKVSTTAAANGAWMVRLNPQKAGGPFKMKISGTNTVVLDSIYIGEVWICSGQSNMERQLGPRSGQKPILNWEQEAASADYPLIRQFCVPLKASRTPLDDCKGKWIVCKPTTAKDFSAVGLFFARDLYQKIKVPIGIIHTARGGSAAEAWVDENTLRSLPETKSIVDEFEQRLVEYPKQLDDFLKNEQEIMQKYKQDVENAKKEGKNPPRNPKPVQPGFGSADPAGFYNAMLSPIIPLSIKGVAWYQGESNNGKKAKTYQWLLPLMVEKWRKDFQQGDFPFIYVQVAPFRNMNPEIRESQLLCLPKIKNSAMVVTTDCGDSADIHPTNKRPVGERISLAAQALAYEYKIEYMGPIYQNYTIKGKKFIITFTHADGLIARDGELKGFSIAGTDNKFLPATARINGSTVEVWADAIDSPQAVRYGWENVPHVNLYNAAGLPASPFRTDQKN